MESRSTFLVASTPITAHTLNATPIVQGLVDAGHRVLWYVARRYAEHAVRVGAEPLPFRSARDYAGVDFEPYVARGIVDGLSVVRRLYAEVLVGEARAHLTDLIGYLEDEPVDALVSDTLMMAAGLVAERNDIAWATFGDGPLLWRDADTPPFGTGLQPLSGRPGRHRNRTVQRAIDRWLFSTPLAAYNELRACLDLPSVGNLQAAAVSPLLHMQGCSPGFEYPRAELPSHVRFIGALGPGVGFAPPLPAELARSNRTHPLAFVTQGTLRHDMSELVLPATQALTAEGFDVLIAAGPAADAELDRIRGESVTAMDRVCYQSALAEADLFVTNGGYTGVTLALAAGVPVLQVGATEEKVDIGARLEWAGVGRSIRELRPGVRRLRRAIRRLVNSPEHVQASRRLAAEMRAYDARVLGPRLVADLAASKTS